MGVVVRIVMALTCALGALLLGGSGSGAAQPGVVKGDIDYCPGLAGQPSARRDLIAEYLRLPSLAQPAGTPANLNQTNFIRIRRRDADPRRVDAVLIHAIPNGATSFTELGAQIVEMAALRGKNFEVWAVERREKNLQDLAGMREAFVHRNPALALKYYYGNSYLDGAGKFNGKLGGAGAPFAPLRQSDVPFLADWDASVMYGDIETILDLVPAARRRTNVFAYGSSYGGGILSALAGFKLHDGKRGYQELGGLIAVEGQITRASAGRDPEPTDADIAKYVAAVQAVRSGATPRFVDGDIGMLARGRRGEVLGSILTMSALLKPNAESIFPIVPGAAGGAPAEAFNAKLRLTNQARFGFNFADDPIPGSFTGTWFQSWVGARMGRLDFPRITAAMCAAPGPFGLTPPCVPSAALVDTSKIYGWLNGGEGGAGEFDGPLAGWTRDSAGAYDGSRANHGPDPTSIVTAAEVFGLPSTRTNLEPLTIDFPTGRRTIDASFGYGFAWYTSNRYYGVDIPFIDRFRKVLVDRPELGIHLDFDKTAVKIPVIEYTLRHNTTNPFGGKDFTVVESGGIAEQTPLAAKLSPMNPAITTRLYNNMDYHLAGNGRYAAVASGKLAPGEVGADPVADTVVDWILARSGKTPFALPAFPATHVSCGG